MQSSNKIDDQQTKINTSDEQIVFGPQIDMDDFWDDLEEQAKLDNATAECRLNENNLL